MHSRLLALLVFVAPSVALAENVFDAFGFGPRSVAMSGAMTAEADDFSAVFYNPALLVGGTEVKVGSGMTFTESKMSVRSRNPQKTLDCLYCDPGAFAGVTFGAMFPLGGKIDYRAAFGIGAHLPTVGLTHVRAADPQRPFWARYHNDQDRMVIFAGLGLLLLDQLSVGVGVQFHGGLTGTGLNASIDMLGKKVRLREIDSYLSQDLAPTAGIYFEPMAGLRFGLNYRAQFSMDYSVPADMTLIVGGQKILMDMTITGTIHYTPHTFSLGAAWDPLDEATVSMDLQYAMWSGANEIIDATATIKRSRSPYMTFGINMGGELLASLGLGDQLDIFAVPPPPGYFDVFSARVGAEYRFGELIAVRAGGAYKPTPVPQQDAQGSNILDSNAFVVAAGVGLKFQDPIEVFREPLMFDLGATANFLTPRVASKSADDPEASYEYQGVVFNVQAQVRYAF